MVSKKAVDSSPFVRLQEFLAVSGASRRPVDKILISLSDPESALSPDNENVFCPMYMAQILTDAKSLQILGMSLSNIPLSIEPDDRSKSTDRGRNLSLKQKLKSCTTSTEARCGEWGSGVAFILAAKLLHPWLKETDDLVHSRQIISADGR